MRHLIVYLADIGFVHFQDSNWRHFPSAVFILKPIHTVAGFAIASKLVVFKNFETFVAIYTKQKVHSAYDRRSHERKTLPFGILPTDHISSVIK